MLSILVSITLLLSGEIHRVDDNAGLREAAFAAFQTGQYLTAEELSHRALDLAQLSGNEYDMALSYSALGDVLQAERRLAEAERNYGKAISLLGHQRERAHDAAIVWRSLAAGLTAEARYREALAALKEASTLVSKNKLEDPGLNAQILNNLGFIYYNQGKRDKAEKLFLAASGFQFTPSNPLDVDQWQILNNLGRLYQFTNKYEKAEDLYKRALQLVEVRRGPSHPGLSVVLDNLGMLYARTGRYREAESQFQRSLAILEHSRMSFDAIFMMRTLYGLGEAYRRQNDAVRAEEMLARAAEIARRLVRPSEMPEVVEILDSDAKVLNDLSHSAEAQRLEMEAERIRATMAYTVPLGNAN
jgi:tetratricopeptide (TPR) repeat protein